MDWPTTPEALVVEQERLAALAPPPWRWRPDAGVGGVFVCFPTGLTGAGAAGDRAWAGAALVAPGGVRSVVAVEATAGAPYEAGLLALREGPVLQLAVGALPEGPDVLLVNATGRDHPRRAGLALHLGAVLEIPSVGVTHRPLLAGGDWPPEEAGARSPLLVDGELTGCWLRVRAGARPLAVHAAWRTDPPTAVAVVRSALGNFRTPEPLRLARNAARRARAAAEHGIRTGGTAARGP